MAKDKKDKFELPKTFGKYCFGNIILYAMFTSFAILLCGSDVVIHAWQNWGEATAFAFGVLFLMQFLCDGLTLMHRDNIEYLKDELDKAKAEIEELKKKLND